MKNKLYVGNLSYGVDDDSLSAHFSEVGSVTSARVIRDRESGRSKGFGFVEMADDNAANDAISRLDGTEIDGRSIRVSLAREDGPRPNRGGGGGFRGR
jgi:RNA recognition motif-containing protein